MFSVVVSIYIHTFNLVKVTLHWKCTCSLLWYPSPAGVRHTGGEKPRGGERGKHIIACCKCIVCRNCCMFVATVLFLGIKGIVVNTSSYSSVFPALLHSFTIWKSGRECQISGMIFDNIWSGKYLVARSSGICEISAAQSLKILRQITAVDCGQQT